MRKNAAVHIGVLLIALAGMTALRMATRWGPGVGGDATIYIESARNLLDGKGLGLIGPQGEFRLLPYFPPFFSLTLAGLGMTGASLLTAAHWINILSFGGLIVIIGYATLSATHRGRFAILASLLIVGSPVLIPVYSWAMSEPLSLLLGFGALAGLAAWLENPENRCLLFLSALAAGLSFLTRYSSVAYLIAGGAGVFLLGSQKWRQKIFDTVLYLFIGALPMLVWLIYDLNLTATVASRSVESGTGMASRLSSFWPLLREVILFWLVPDSWITSPRYPSGLNLFFVSGFVFIITVWCVCAGRDIFRVKERWKESRITKLLVLLLLFIVAYLAAILLVYVTTYPPITIGSRMMSPVHVAVLWLVILLTTHTIKTWGNKRWLQIALLGGLALAILWYGGRSVRIVNQYFDTGLGYTSPTWQNSQTLAAVRDLPSDILLISNETNAILFLSGRPAYPLKEIYQDKPSSSFTTYGNGDPQDEYQKLFREGKAVLVLFDTIDDQLSGLYGERTAERISALVKGLRRAYRGEDGGIFYYDSIP